MNFGPEVLELYGLKMLTSHRRRDGQTFDRFYKTFCSTTHRIYLPSLMDFGPAVLEL